MTSLTNQHILFQYMWCNNLNHSWMKTFSLWNMLDISLYVFKVYVITIVLIVLIDET